MRWLFWIKERPKDPQEQLTKLSKSGRFYGVKLYRSRCRACSLMAGTFFTFEDAPQLPLKDCDASECCCEYLGVTDRRSHIERRSGKDRRECVRMKKIGNSILDRRPKLDRRSKLDRRLDPDMWIGYDQ